MVEINIDTREIKVATNLLQVQRFRLRNLAPAFQKSAPYLKRKIDLSFRRQSGASKFGATTVKRWARNKPSTIKQKGHGIVLVGGGRRRGRLKRTIRINTRGNKLTVSYLKYGDYAMHGFTDRAGKKVRPRAFAFPTKQTLNKIAQNIAEYVAHGATKR